LLEGLLPPSVISVETRDDRLDVELFPEEESALGRAVDKRRREFTTGRACAREALARLGAPSTAVGSGRHGEPLWPSGVVGSITHCEGYRACAVASARAVRTLGIDAERDARLSDGVWAQVARRGERGLRAATTSPVRAGPHLDAVLFSAKEAVYKAWFPLAGRRLGFDDVEVSLDLINAEFNAKLLVRGPVVNGANLSEFRGRWALEEGVICTAVIVPASHRPAPAWQAALDPRSKSFARVETDVYGGRRPPRWTP
jgi:4'-phosphopantetheinyl transferase EntD